MLDKTKKRLVKKFSRLPNCVIFDNNIENMVIPNIPNTDSLCNLTDLNIPDNIKILLCYGPKFVLPSIKNKNPLFEMISDIEYSLDNLVINKDINQSIIQEHRFNLLNKISSFIKSSKKESPKEKYLLNATKTLNLFLKNNPNILILNSDKSKKTVIMLKDDYNCKMNDLLMDQTVYEKLNKPPIVRAELPYKITHLLRTKQITDEIYKKVTCINPITPRIYGLPKLHKNGIPLRPIVSNINSLTYFISKHFVSILNHLTENSQYNIKNSFELKNKLNTIILSTDDILASFDVKSLFTNIPIEIVLSEINVRWVELESYTNIKKQDFIDLLKIILTKHNFFTYNNIVYKQISGLAMGNPLSPILADIVLEKLFKESIPKLNVQPSFLVKYVDDILIILPPEHMDNTQRIFNSFHNSIQFTTEIESNNQLSFLDMTLNRNDQKILTDWYIKPTSSIRILNYHSFHPINIKLNVVRSFINRVFTLSDVCFKEKNKKIVEEYLEKNDYPRRLIKKMIRDEIYKITVATQQNLVPNHNVLIDNTQPNIEELNNQEIANQPLVCAIIPYIPNLSYTIKNILMTAGIDRVTFKINNKLETYFTKLKDQLRKETFDNVIYKIPCGACNKMYIGQTANALKTRLQRHQSDIRNNKKDTALCQHVLETKHIPDFSKTEIIHRGVKIKKKRLTLESLNILLNQNTMNFRTDTENINSTYKFIIHLFNKYMKNKN